MKEKINMEELIKMNPEDMSQEQVLAYKQIQNKAMALRDADMKLYNSEVVYKETQAREHKANRDMKVYTLENIEATIKMEDLYPAYEEALKKANARMEKLRSADPREESKLILEA